MNRLFKVMPAIAGLVVCLVLAFKLSSGIHVTLINGAATNLDQVRIEYTGGAVEWITIEPSAAVTARIRASGESTLSLTFRANGTTHRFEHGYFESGYRGRVQLKVNGDYTLAVNDNINSYPALPVFLR